MSKEQSIKEYLEYTYDIPFDIDTGMEHSDPWIRIVPKNEDKSLFSILLAYKNAIRLNMSLKPQKFGANMVYAMGNSTEEQKQVFCSFVDIMKENGAKISFTINDSVCNPLDYREWSDKWNNMDLEATLRPISEDDIHDSDYEELSKKWSQLMVGTALSLLNIVPVDRDGSNLLGYEEGNCVKVLTNHYERNPLNRFLCIQKYGYVCQVCGFDFEKTYSTIGKDFIHVHHKVPVSKMGEHYIVNPLEDLVPVCPNCHCMLHRNDPPISVEELKKMLLDNENQHR